MKRNTQSSMGPILRAPTASAFLFGCRSVALVALVAAGCGGVTETEMFSESSAELAKKIGEVCASPPFDDPSAVNVDDRHPDCEPGYCVTRGGEPGAGEGEGVCSCRCDGPSGTGPFCRCSDDYSCQPLIEDIGLGNRELAGSYCMPH